jgi:beta-mannosidase
MKFRRCLAQLIYFSLFELICVAGHQVGLSETDFSWKLSTCDGGRIIDLPSSVPGNVFVDLIRAGIINGDPYFRFNERDYSWIANECWSYKTDPFAFEHLSTRSAEESLYLRVEGVDTIAEIFLNDDHIGNCSNVFHPHVFGPIDMSLLAKAKTNVLRIDIKSALVTAHAKASAYPYKIPATENYNVWAEPSDRSFVRKPGSDFGWDWGPAFVPAGIYGGVSFIALNGLQMKGLHLRHHLTADLSSGLVDVSIDAYCPVYGEAYASVYLDGHFQFDKSVQIPSTSTERTFNDQLSVKSRPRCLVHLGFIEIFNASLWWPRGLGAQHLYEVEVRLIDSKGPLPPAGTRRSLAMQSLKRRIGLRAVELVQDAVEPGSEESLFYLRINGQSVFVRGANMIPLDSFHSRVTPADREYLLATAAQANMNMLRVWGGGTYQPDDFYDKADEMGIMVRIRL